MSDKGLKEVKKTSIGGQALIEGIMMKGPSKIATAVRKPDGEIVIKESNIKQIFKHKFFKLPLVRGSFVLIDSLVNGVKELMYSAEFYGEDYEEDALDRFLKKVFKDKADTAIIYTSVIIALVFSIAIFILGPTILTNLLKNIIKNSFLLNLVEGIVRVSLFVGYVYLVSKLEDIKRVFMYHGAEHKTIYCYEYGEELTVENVQRYSTLHPRCGTSFLINVLLISIIVFSFFGWPNPLLRLVIRLAMLPVIAGLSYELNRYVGRSSSDNIFTKIIAYPGFLIQKITTKEPDDSMIEVAIAAMKRVIPQGGEDDRW
ncbi:MAG TPA: DUF1385 domain-containing protein [Sedimentibacter sp.]|jgi:uncharacterized protein YqhQ|nr:DUF1385 domain-containing protein [Sedimentibacter sp.]HOA19394.1 DUF1385 domain-containing protein [Sedimentibacter sp.]HOG62547.1 DUF1385 domain-containing protein [Sedimentibacter sp.]HPV84999.1 DUF1385 domain-containing protein [Sedimentibacter sp.]HPY56226.1 DUF1385 domain-containing protein [Sedimentibacter sp.]